MKIAQELRTGNVVMIGKDPMVVIKAEYNKSGRNAAVVKMKMKNLLTDLLYSALSTTMASLPIFTTLPARSS